MATNDFTVFIVDDEASVRDAIALLLGLHDYRTALFADAESFLKAFRPEWRGCLLLDLRMPGMDGLILQRHLRDIGCTLPVIVITGHGDVGSARDAFKAEAIDFLEKPLDNEKLLGALRDAYAGYQAVQEGRDQRSSFAALLASLTPREREVMEMVVAGRHNREIAKAMGISPRTVEVHKARVMQKLSVDSVAQLVRLSLGVANGESHARGG